MPRKWGVIKQLMYEYILYEYEHGRLRRGPGPKLGEFWQMKFQCYAISNTALKWKLSAVSRPMFATKFLVQH